MELRDRSQLTILKTAGIQQDVSAFLVDRKTRNLSPRSVQFYSDELGGFVSFLLSADVRDVEKVTAAHVRTFLLQLAERRNPGGCHAAYRAVRAFLRWFEAEYEPEGWRNPMTKVAAPRVPDVVQDPANVDDVRAMLGTCTGRTFTDCRDKALLLCLLDTGARASEFVALDVSDVDMGTGAVVIQHGKGNKRRSAFLGGKARKALSHYMRLRPASGALWLTDEGGRLTYGGLRAIMRRRAALAGVDVPGLHSFRRAFALIALRNGVDLISLQRLLGHSDLSVIRRYLAQTESDLQAAHQKASPVDSVL